MNERQDQPDDTLRFTLKKQYAYLAFGIVVGFGAGYATAMALSARGAGRVTEMTAPAPLPDFADLPIAVVSDQGRPFRGPADASVTVIEFTDYECPFCGRYFRETYTPLLTAYGDRIKYVVRNFPIARIHPRARAAAEAAECAYEQNRFWEYHDVLFERAPQLDASRLTDYASAVGLDMKAFAECLASLRPSEIVDRDLREGLAYGVSGTPAFFINGRAVVGALTLDQFKEYLDAALELARAEAP